MQTLDVRDDRRWDACWGKLPAQKELAQMRICVLQEADRGGEGEGDGETE